MGPESKGVENLSSCLRARCRTDPGEHEQPNGSMQTVAENIVSETGNRLATVMCISVGLTTLAAKAKSNIGHKELLDLVVNTKSVRNDGKLRNLLLDIVSPYSTGSRWLKLYTNPGPACPRPTRRTGERVGG